MKYSALVFLAALIGLSIPAVAGTYTDRDGTAHVWSVGDAHQLIWDGEPYVPFGTMVEGTGPIPEGASDVLVRGVTTMPVEELQALVDRLEAAGIRYGLDLYDPPYIPLSGYVVNPSQYRVDGIRTAGRVVKQIDGVKTALYALCSSSTAEVRQFGKAITVGGTADVNATFRGEGDYTMLFYPEKTVSGVPDLWSDYERHRDRVFAHLRKIKFGKGLRFVIDPFGEIDLSGEAEVVIPTSPAFRMAYTAWLSRKYGTPRDAAVAWGISPHEIGSFEQAARLVPLWREGRGTPTVYDEKTDRRYHVDISRSGLWKDFQEFREASIRGYMDAMAGGMRKLVADVPMVYTATGLQPIFQPRIYEGLAVPAVDPTDAVARVLALAENSGSNIWIIAKLRPAKSREDVFADINTCRNLGAKGFFGTSTAWMADYASTVDKYFATYKPRVVYRPNGGNRATRLASGAWWLPGLKDGYYIHLGSLMEGYVISGKRGSELYIRSSDGPRKLTLLVDAPVVLVRSNGDEKTYQPKKGKVEIEVDSEPSQVVGFAPERFIPVEMVEEAVQEFEKAVLEIGKAHDPTVYKMNLNRVKEFLKNKQLAVALDMARVNTAEIHRILEAGGGQ
ncbi:MAG: hypothetical protein ACYC2Y_03070 [Armatimonadota bacterium]